jgi:aryl-alcohol dehydrogenase-like predicted oxidoreductase
VTVDGLSPVSKVGLGTMRFGEKGFDPDLAAALIRRALELGITHFGTAGSYGWGHSERLLGEVLAAERAADIVVHDEVPAAPAAADGDRTTGQGQGLQHQPAQGQRRRP